MYYMHSLVPTYLLRPPLSRHSSVALQLLFSQNAKHLIHICKKLPAQSSRHTKEQKDSKVDSLGEVEMETVVLTYRLQEGESVYGNVCETLYPGLYFVAITITREISRCRGV